LLFDFRNETYSDKFDIKKITFNGVFTFETVAVTESKNTRTIGTAKDSNHSSVKVEGENSGSNYFFQTYLMNTNQQQLKISKFSLSDQQITQHILHLFIIELILVEQINIIK
jgi:hypothetical protein